MHKVRSKKALLLDLDNTLYAYEPCHRAALRESYRVYNKYFLSISFKAFHERYQRARRLIHKRLAHQASSHSRLLYFQRFLECDGSRKYAGGALRLEKAYWNAFLKHMKLLAWAPPFLRWCKSQGKKVVIVTNLTTEIQLRKIRRLKLEKWIHAIVTSEEAGVEKPHPRIFRLALQKARCRSRDAMVIGDHRVEDTCSFIKHLRIHRP